MIGLDYAGSERGLLGVGAGYAHTTTQLELEAGKINANSYFAFVYGTMSLSHFFLDVSLLASINRFHNKRHITFPGFTSNAWSKHNGWIVDPHLDLGYDFTFSWGGIEPFVGCDWAFDFENKYTETGAYPLNMTIQQHDSSMLRSEGGIMLYETRQFDDVVFVFKQSLSYVNQTFFGSGKVNAVIVGAPNGVLSVSSFTSSQNLIAPGLEIFAKKHNRASLSLAYQGEYGSGYSQSGVSGTISVYY